MLKAITEYCTAHRRHCLASTQSLTQHQAELDSKIHLDRETHIVTVKHSIKTMPNG